MIYSDLCHYVFSEENMAWSDHALKYRKRELVIARQISMYLGRWFFPIHTDKELAEIFNQDHATSQHAFKTVRNLMFSDKEFRCKIDKYLAYIKEEIRKSKEESFLKQMEDEKFREKLLDTIDSMELIAKVYCDIKGLKLTKIE